MKKHLLTILSLFAVAIIISIAGDVFSYDNTSDNDNSYIIDERRSDIESIFNTANSSKTTLPELQNTLPTPSFRHMTSQKKTQHNIINTVLIKRFSPEARPTKNYNNKFSFPLSSKENLIVIVRHLII